MTRAEPLSFVGLRSVHPRTRPITQIVCHWTGGAGDAERVYATLRARKGRRTPDGLSVHYIVETSGRVVQMAPHDVVCLHASEANEASIGIEVVCPGYASGAAYRRELGTGVPRVKYLAKLHGVPVVALSFTDAQQDALGTLCERLCAEHAIPRRLPLERDGSLMLRAMKPAELAAYAGVLGHYHVTRRKSDPGSLPLERLRDRWR